MYHFFTQRALLNWVSVLLIAVLTYQLALVIWRQVEPMPLSNGVMPFNPQQLNQQKKQLSNAQLIRSIIQLKPFGQVQEKKVVEQQVESIQAPETKLSYKLRGIYYSDNNLLSSAIVEVKSNDVQSFAEKEDIEEGISIHAIELKHIVLERYGKYETLSLEEIKFDKKNKSLIVDRGNNTNSNHNALLKRYKKRFMNNPMALARKFRAIPVTDNGKNIGFKLKAVRGETLLKKLEVPNDAIFTSINGVGLDKPFQALDALKSLQTSDKISVTYLLNGTEESRDFEL